MAKDNISAFDPIFGRRSNGAHNGSLIALIVICSLLEGALSLADLGLVGQGRIRGLAYEYGGFWPGLLKGWAANYELQPYAMFLTYSFLHGGLTHLVINMITLWSLGNAVIERVGLLGFSMLYGTSVMGGAAGYALLAPGLQPMVGASGALFGLAGGLLAWLYVDRFTFRQGLLPVAQAVALLVVLNLVMWWAMDGLLAWQTHLGGFLTGWLVAMLIDPRAHEPDSDPQH